MPRTNQNHLELAKQLLALEAEGATVHDLAAAAGRVYERLYQRLAPLIGGAGVRALFARSLRLTKAEFPFLAEIHVVVEPKDGDGEPSRALADGLSKADPAVGSNAAAALYANFFGVMADFVGERLVRQVLRRAFPTLDQSLPKEKE